MPYFGQEQYELLSSNARTLFDEKSPNQFYIHISVVGIPYNYLFSCFYIVAYKCVWYVVRSNNFNAILTNNVTMIRINLFIYFNQLNLIVI